MIQLFHKIKCPFSKKVRDFVEGHGLKDHLEYRDIDNDAGALQELEKLAGNRQVPTLLMDGEVIQESDIIIDCLNDRFSQEIAS